MKRISGVFLVTAVLTGFALPARATMMEQLDTQRLTKYSKSIHVGTVVQRWADQDKSNGMIYTYSRLQIEQTLKGEPAGEVVIRTPGGQVGSVGMVVHGMASFTQREHVLVFLSHDKDGSPSVVGMSQGKYRLFKSPATGEEMAMFQAPQDVAFFTHGQKGKIRHVVSSQVERRVPLHRLMGEIRSTVAREEGETLNP